MEEVAALIMIPQIVGIYTDKRKIGVAIFSSFPGTSLIRAGRVIGG